VSGSSPKCSHAVITAATTLAQIWLGNGSRREGPVMSEHFLEEQLKRIREM